MIGRNTVFLAALAAIALVGCGGAGDGDYTQQRGISADIDATHDHGPTSAEPGIAGRQEPPDALPWQTGERHPGE